MTQTEHELCRVVDAQEAFSVLQKLKDVHILIHRSPDGDCVGSGYALHLLLRSLGIRSRVCCADPIPAVFDELTQGITFEDFPAQALVSVDVASRKLFGDLPPEDKDGEIALCIDHHISNTHYAKHLHWDHRASAACEVLYYFIKVNQLPLTRQMALCLYVGMATDTGSFQFDCTRAETFEAVAEIRRAFPDLPYAALNRALFVLKTQKRIQLDGHLMQHVQRSEDGKVALIYVEHALLESLQLSSYEVDGISNLPMQMIGVEIGITVKEQPNGSYRVSMRGGDRADVSAVCQQFGGGGHIKASGCSIDHGTPQEVCGQLMAAAEASLV